MEKKENRGGKRTGAGRPLQSKDKGKKSTHSMTFNDDVWESIIEEADKLSLSASQYLAMIHKEYMNK